MAHSRLQIQRVKMIVMKKLLFNPKLEQERIFAYRHVCSKVRKAELTHEQGFPKVVSTSL